MKFQVTKDNNSFSMGPQQLLELLLSKVASEERAEFINIAGTLGEYLEQRSLLKSMNIMQLLTVAFSLGYYYRVFLQKNDVSITGTANDTENPGQSSDETIGGEVS